jgi:hypothetical protein
MCPEKKDRTEKMMAKMKEQRVFLLQMRHEKKDRRDA